MSPAKVVARPVKRSEYSKVKQVIAKAFAPKSENPPIPGFINIELADPDYFWGVFVDDEPVAGVMLVPFEIMIDGTLLRVVGFTGVGTHPNHLHKGYASKLIKGVYQYLITHGFDGAILHSSADTLYIKHNFEFAFCKWECKMNSSELTQKLDKKISVISDKYRCTDLKTEFYLVDEVSKDLTDWLHIIRENSSSYIDRRVKSIRSQDFMNQIITAQMKKGFMLSVSYQNDIPWTYCLFKLENQGLSIVEIFSKDKTTDSIIFIIQEILEQFEPLPNFILIKSYFQDKLITKFIEDFDGKLYKSFLVGNMATLFSPNEVLNRMIPTFNKRLQDLNEHFNEQFIISIDNEKFLFKIEESNLSIDLIEENNINSELQIFYLTKREWIALTYGYIPIEDTSIDDVKCSPNIRDLLDNLYPELEPIWDYLQEY